jgi:hypothetical protein
VLAADVLLAVELDVLLLLELPHADSASAASGTTKIICLLTGFNPLVGRAAGIPSSRRRFSAGVSYPTDPHDAQTDAFLPADERRALAPLRPVP